MQRDSRIPLMSSGVLLRVDLDPGTAPIVWQPALREAQKRQVECDFVEPAVVSHVRIEYNHHSVALQSAVA